MIGKGKRTPEVLAAIREHKAVYFGATGGTAVLLADSVKHAEREAYEDLGPEAVLPRRRSLRKRSRRGAQEFFVISNIDFNGTRYKDPAPPRRAQVL